MVLIESTADIARMSYIRAALQSGNIAFVLNDRNGGIGNACDFFVDEDDASRAKDLIDDYEGPARGGDPAAGCEMSPFSMPSHWKDPRLWQLLLALMMGLVTVASVLQTLHAPDWTKLATVWSFPVLWVVLGSRLLRKRDD